MWRTLLGWLSQFSIKLAHLAQGDAGLNAMFLVSPTRFVIPTLVKHGAIIGQEVEFCTPMVFHNTSRQAGAHYSNLIVGSQCYFGKDVFLDLSDRIVIEDAVTISMRATILTHTDPGKSPLASVRLNPSHAPVVLRCGCYIGAGAIILAGVEVGEMAIVGAGAVVTNDVASHTTVVGVPARPISQVTAKAFRDE